MRLRVGDRIQPLRVYHKGMPPTEALRNMFQWSKCHFNPTLVQAFIKGIGIYPAGSLAYLPPAIVALAESDDKIVAHESFEKWNIDQAAWL